MYIVLDICIYFVFIKPEPKLYASSYCIYDGHLYIICTGLYHIFSMLCVYNICADDVTATHHQSLYENSI